MKSQLKIRLIFDLFWRVKNNPPNTTEKVGCSHGDLNRFYFPCFFTEEGRATGVPSAE